MSFVLTEPACVCGGVWAKGVARGAFSGPRDDGNARELKFGILLVRAKVARRDAAIGRSEIATQIFRETTDGGNCLCVRLFFL